MRNIKLFVLGITVLLFSCNTDTPEQTIKEFYSAIKSKDFEKAKSLSTEQSHSTIDMLSSGLEVNIGSGELTNIDCVEENEKGECDCFFENNEKPVAVSVVKSGGKWKVDVKETAKQMMNNLFESFKDIDLNGLLDKAKEFTDDGGEQLNELIKSVDPEKVKKLTEGMDSNIQKLGESLEGLLK